MKHKKLLTLATLAGLTLGGLSVATVASAQGYGGDADTTEPTAAEADTDNAVLQIQDTEGDDAVEGDDTDDDAAEDDTTDGDTTDGDGERDGRRGGCNLDDEAAAIGIETAELEAAIDGGQTIAEVAEANGVDADTVIDALVEAKVERLDGKVEEGRLTQEEADAKLASATEKITNRVNGVTEEATA